MSLGVQSFAAAARRALGRRAAADPAAAFAELRRAGCAEIGVDLIFGGPGQDLAALDDDLARVVALRPEHISYYELGVVPGTPLACGLEGERDALPAGDEELAEMFRRIVRCLGRAGYDWYEVSNFALPRHRSRHNSAYWRTRPYLGLGPGAVSTVGARRWRDAPDLAAWRAALAAGGGRRARSKTWTRRPSPVSAFSWRPAAASPSASASWHRYSTQTPPPSWPILDWSRSAVVQSG